MTTWIIEPHDPLIVRDGRPFGPNPGARAVSLNFPFPSTIAGGVRTRAGLDENGIFDRSNIEHIKKIPIRGPLLIELDGASDTVKDWLVPAPADALLLEKEKDDSCVQRKRLVPITLAEDEETNSPGKDLYLVGQVVHESAKPSKKAPAFWYWSKFEQWLMMTGFVDEKDVRLLGHNGPVQDSRIHVQIDPDTQAAQEKKLFETCGLTFIQKEQVKDEQPDNKANEGQEPKEPKEPEYTLSGAKHLALAVTVDDNNIAPGIAAFGGERRMVHWRKGSNLPACPNELIAQIKKACRVILLTPAHFDGGGWRPNDLLKQREGVKPTLKAVAMQRYQVVSGWHLHLNDKKQPGRVFGKPKKSRRLVPAGTVFYLTLEGDEEAIKNWVNDIWMKNISDDERSCQDGFGLAVVGAWDGEVREMELKGEE